ncbi:MAG: TIGR03936 family radical SAM-associated protein [Anaeromicrobium sp.]|jgi:radical SAM-linked protein|uniref:TIGR03936 family radical SAM-associated protein n=1 Tax=Anaeromicrobium sp. TaxID=1929132 RepID=UPI0025D3F9AF|nr:TIGR03936 family radical SAM-associated protein [Anaeromicrobium sp.]MCT4594957.1 TIGR03936 family radical SAM-associated protein [Anaeromicrobium sp.]
MCKVRIRFKKNGYMIFTSHLDLMRIIERTLRRARVPISFSQGFNPHAKMSFATALALGVSSDGEYMDMELDEKVDLDNLVKRINKELPEGIEVIQCKFIHKKAKSLMSIIKYSSYVINLKLDKEISEEELRQNIEEFLKEDEIIIEKYSKKKNKTRKVDIKPMIKSIQVINMDRENLLLKALLAAGSEQNIKPEIVMDKMFEKMDFFNKEYVRVHRLELYAANKRDEMVTPLDDSIA